MKLIDVEKAGKEPTFLRDIEIAEYSTCGLGRNPGTPIALKKGNPEATVTKEEIAALKKAAEEGKKAKEEAEKAKKDSDAKIAHLSLLASLTDVEKGHMESMDDKAKEAYLAKSADERKVEAKEAVKKAQEDDEQLEVAGVTVKKSAVGDASFAIMKAMAAENKAAKEIAVLEKAKREQAETEAEAESTFDNLAGSPADKAKLLKAAKDDEKVMEILKSANAAMGANFDEIGSSAPAGADGSSPNDRMETLVKSYMNENPGVDEPSAYAAVMDTPAGRKAYKETM